MTRGLIVNAIVTTCKKKKKKKKKFPEQLGKSWHAPESHAFVPNGMRITYKNKYSFPY